MSSSSWWKPNATEEILWQLQTKKGPIITPYDLDMYNVDLFNTKEEIIRILREEHGAKVVCHFSAGIYEPWQPDWESYFSFLQPNTPYEGSAAPFLGNAGNNGERWLDVRRLDLLMHIMGDRLDLAKRKGCDAVQPNNIDAFNHQGIPGLSALKKFDQMRYNTWLATEAHERNLSVGLSGDINQLLELEPHFDWAFSERCFQYQECDAYAVFSENNKAVFSLQFKEDEETFCPELLLRKLPLMMVYNTYNYQLGCQLFVLYEDISQESIWF